MAVRHWLFCSALLLAGCSVTTITPVPDGPVGPDEPVVVEGQWRNLGHDTGVKLCHLHAQIMRDACDKGPWDDPKALGAWIQGQLNERESGVFVQMKAAQQIALMKDKKYDWSKHEPILRETADGYDAVK